MASRDTTDGKSRMLYPMLLGGVSAFSILILASFLVAMYKDRCCSRKQKRSNTYHRISDVKVRKEAKIAYDIPMKSKALISSVWQQEENDIADEVKRMYRNISDSSKPVLFGSGTGVFLQDMLDCGRPEFGFIDKQANSKAEKTRTKFQNIHLRNEGAKFKGDEMEIRDAGTKITTEEIDRRQEQQKVEYEETKVFSAPGAEKERNKNEYIDRNPEQTRFLEGNKQNNDVGLEEGFDMKIPESVLTKVQDWVNDSFRNADVNMGEISGHKVEAASVRSKGNMVELEKKLGNRNVVKSGVVIENNGDDKKHSELVFDKESQKDLSESKVTEVHSQQMDRNTVGSKREDNFLQKSSFVDSSNMKSNVVTEPKAINLKLSSNEEFQRTANVKNLILTRWVDHAAQHQQTKSGDMEEDFLESGNTSIEKSFNELQYEDIESILTSVSRMDEKRIQQLKSTDFYKGLLLKSVRKRILENSNTRSTAEKQGEKGAVREFPIRARMPLVKHGQSDVTNGEKQKVSIGGNAIINYSKSMLHPTARHVGTDNKIFTRQSEAPNETSRNREDIRCSLSESTIHDESSECSEGSATCIEASKTLGTRRFSTTGSEKSSNDNAVLLKYSIVRNFSNRFRPFVYVSLTHIQSLDRWIKKSSFVVRIYLANDENSVQESGLIACDSNVYIEEMFAVQGSSTKSILNDSLVIEIVCGDEKEIVGYVSVELKGLRYKATLLSTVGIKRKQL